MDCLLRSRFLQQLSFLATDTQQLIINYLSVLSARHYARGTLDGFVVAIKRFIRHVPEPRRALLTDNLTTATACDLDNFIKSAQATGLAPSTINLTLSLLRDFFDFLLENGEIQRQPVSRHRHRVCAPTTLPKPMAEADLISFFKVIDSVRDRLIFLLMLRCGLRVSEACALSWKDVDFNTLTLRINNGQGEVDRIAYLAPDVQHSLKLWHARNSTSAYLFPSRKVPSHHLTRGEIYHLMINYLQCAGLPHHYSPHCLRHTFATQLLNAGVSLEVLKELMGHRSIQMTLRYTQLYEATKRQQYTEAMARLEKRQAMMGR